MVDIMGNDRTRIDRNPCDRSRHRDSEFDLSQIETIAKDRIATHASSRHRLIELRKSTESIGGCEVRFETKAADVGIRSVLIGNWS